MNGLRKLTDKAVYERIGQHEKAAREAKEEMRRRGYYQTPLGMWKKDS